MILKFISFIKEELTSIKKDGCTNLIYDDVLPSVKSSASSILLNDKLRMDELESISNMLGSDIPKNFLDNPRTLKLLVIFNNLKFLKDMLEKYKELRCEYCSKGPLVIYDISKNSDNIFKFLKNPWHKMNVKFDSSNGATCDHKEPQSKGGDKFNYNNLAICCSSCNQKKSNLSYKEWMDYLKSK